MAKLSDGGARVRTQVQRPPPERTTRHMAWGGPSQAPQQDTQAPYPRRPASLSSTRPHPSQPLSAAHPSARFWPPSLCSCLFPTPPNLEHSLHLTPPPYVTNTSLSLEPSLNFQGAIPELQDPSVPRTSQHPEVTGPRGELKPRLLVIGNLVKKLWGTPTRQLLLKVFQMNISDE